MDWATICMLHDEPRAFGDVSLASRLMKDLGYAEVLYG
jgi:hypothetical protein